MRNRSLLRALSVFGIFLICFFTAASVDARGGGRGGGGRGGGGRGGGGFGGGGRSISRSGPAGGGSFGGSRGSYGGGSRGSLGDRSRGSVSDRSTLGDRSRASVGDRERPSQLPDRGGDVRPERPERPSDRPDRDQAREDWQQNQQQRQQNRQNYANQAREDRQDAWDDAFDDIDDVYYGHGHYYDVDDWVAGVAIIAVGTTLTFAAFDAMARDSNCTPSQVTVSGTVYYRCGSSWYQKVMSSGNPTYVVVEAPAGY